MENNQPHSLEHGSIELELIAHASHTHALYQDDNSTVYHYLEEATHSTSYAASIKPFQCGKDGHGAWIALIGQYAGRDKWEAEIKKQEQLLHSRIWKEQSNFLLEHFITQHRNAFISMQACAEHIQYQPLNAHLHVGYLLDAISVLMLLCRLQWQAFGPMMERMECAMTLKLQLHIWWHMIQSPRNVWPAAATSREVH